MGLDVYTEVIIGWRVQRSELLEDTPALELRCSRSSCSQRFDIEVAFNYCPACSWKLKKQKITVAAPLLQRLALTLGPQAWERLCDSDRSVDPVVGWAHHPHKLGLFVDRHHVPHDDPDAASLLLGRRLFRGRSNRQEAPAHALETVELSGGIRALRILNQHYELGLKGEPSVFLRAYWSR